MSHAPEPEPQQAAPMSHAPEPEPLEPQPQQAPAQAAHPALDSPSQDARAAHRPPWRVAAVEKAASGDRPLMIALVGVIGLLLGLPMYLISNEIDEIEHKVDALDERIDARFDRQGERIDARFDSLERDFDSLERDVGEINLRLTALIAALNATDEVEVGDPPLERDPAPIAEHQEGQRANRALNTSGSKAG